MAGPLTLQGQPEETARDRSREEGEGGDLKVAGSKLVAEGL